MGSLSLQRRYAPENRCFGCGPANEKGLRIESHVAEDGSIVCDFQPEPHHLAFANIVNGGIIGALFDCHMNWAAAYHLMLRQAATALPCTVTADFHVKLRRPTPLDQPLRIVARPAEMADDRAVIEATLTSGGVVTASCRGTFVEVKEGHPAFHRW